MTPEVCPVSPQIHKKKHRTPTSSLSPRLVRTREAADYLAISRWKIRELVRDGSLVSIDDGKGGPWRFDLRDLDAYIERCKRSGSL